MIDELKIEATDNTPEILFSPKNNKFEIKGTSYPENVLSFYQVVLDWVSEYIKNPNEITEFNFFIDYFNSSSARIIVEIIVQLEEIIKTGKKVYVKWHYNANDKLMKERGEEIKSVVYLPFELVENI